MRFVPVQAASMLFQSARLHEPGAISIAEPGQKRRSGGCDVHLAKDAGECGILLDHHRDKVWFTLMLRRASPSAQMVASWPLPAQTALFACGRWPDVRIEISGAPIIIVHALL
jgi:hypothetical protein